MSRAFSLSDTVDSVDTVSTAHASTESGATCGRYSVHRVNSVNGAKERTEEIDLSLVEALAVLERRCPDGIEAGDWQHAVEDGRRFIVQWGDQAAALGWSADDLLGLQPVPPSPHPTFRRLSRYDLLGLVWMLRGRPVTALTTESAVIAASHGGTVTFRRLPNASRGKR